MFLEKLEGLISSPKRVISTFFAFILVLSLPLTVLLINRQQDIRQQAAGLYTVNGKIIRINPNGTKTAASIPGLRIKLIKQSPAGADRFATPDSNGNYTFNIFNQALFIFALDGLPKTYTVMKSPANGQVMFLPPATSVTAGTFNFEVKDVGELTPQPTVVLSRAPTPTPITKLPTATPTKAPTPTPVGTLGVLAGIIWKDNNGNGIKDGVDAGFVPTGTKVTLTPISDSTKSRTAIPGVNGRYEFNIFNQQLYTLGLTGLPTGYTVIKTPNKSVAFNFPPAAGTTAPPFDFYIKPPITTPTPTTPELGPPTKTPTPINLPTATPTKAPTPTLTKAPTPTPTKAPTPTPTKILTPTPTTVPQPGDTLVNFAFKLPGISSADVPNRQSQPTTVYLFNNNQEVISVNTSSSFKNGSYFGTANLGKVTPGSYTVKIKVDNSLRKTIPGITNLASGTNDLTSQVATLITGDLSNNNQIDISDYNDLISCMRNEPSCTADDKLLADFNDDGTIDDGRDLNILFQAFATIKGD